jgi:hypothetical protein
MCCVVLALTLIMLAGCGMIPADPQAPDEQANAPLSSADDATASDAATDEQAAGNLADVLSVDASGDPNMYQFAVEIASPDTGCDQYANWWEVVNEDGELIYRRVLTHSHVDEQPFIRSGGPVEIGPDTPVWVRAHMHPDGYGGAAFYGTVSEGFEQTDLAPDFADDVAEEEPLPEGCAF